MDTQKVQRPKPKNLHSIKQESTITISNNEGPQSPVSTEIVKSSKNKKKASHRGQHMIPKQTSIAAVIPPEVFIKICENLPPEALLSLSRVCRRYREFLYSTTSSLSQQMWTTSRLNFMRTLPLPPPNDMDEIAYIKLALLQRGCQFCPRKAKPKVYWAFRVRCCRKCLSARTQKELHIPHDFVSCLPFAIVEGVRYYWTTQAQAAKLEYNEKATNLEKENFLNQLIQKRDERMADATAREEAAKKGLALEMEGNKHKLSVLIERMSRETTDEGTPKYNIEDLKKCPSYLKVSCALDQAINATLLKRAIANEYERISAGSVKKKKQNEVLQLIVKLRLALRETRGYQQYRKSLHQNQSENNSLLKPVIKPDSMTQRYARFALDIISAVSGRRDNTSFMQPLNQCEKLLRFCPSFVQPPYDLDEMDENFLLKVFIPKLCREAAEIDKQFQPCFTIGKALAQGWAAQRVFKCKFCMNRKLFNYAGLKQHLFSLRHGVQTIEAEKMIRLHLMHGIMSDGPGNFWLAHLPIPNITEPTDVIAKVEISGLCDTDTQITKSRFGQLDKRTVMGHQFVAKVCDTGSEVKILKNGDRVICPPQTSCGECFYCERDATCHCERGEFFGWTVGGKRFDGGQAEYVRIPLAETSLIKVQDEISDKEALLLADYIPVGYFCAENGLNQLSEEERTKCVVVVIGCTPVGLAAIAAAFHLGAKRVFAIDHTLEKLNLARKFGATVIHVRNKEDSSPVIKRATGGRGADVLLITEHEATIELALKALRPAGILSVATMNCQPLMEITSEQDAIIISKHCPMRQVIPKAMSLVLSKKFDFEEIVSHTLPLRDAEEGYKIVKNSECIMMAFIVTDQYPEP